MSRATRRGLMAALVLAAGLSGASQAHDLQHAIEPGKAVVVRLFYSDAAKFSFEAYEVYRDGEKVPFQVGRTDALGRLAFLPDRAGTWRIKATSGDGHGTEFTLTAGADAVVTGVERPFFDRHARVVAGVGILFGLFGLLTLFIRRKDRP